MLEIKFKQLLRDRLKFVTNSKNLIDSIRNV